MFNSVFSDIEFVRTVDGLPPTKTSALPLNELGKKGRGSIVFFNQATMYQSSESGHHTLKQARAAGVLADGRYKDVTNEQFSRSDVSAHAGL